MSVETTKFKVNKTDIDGLLIIDVNLIEDERGYFQEKYRNDKLVEAGLPKDFKVVQNNISFNKEAGIVRGFHAEPWNKYISVVSGEVFCAYIDLRPGLSFGKTVTVSINPSIAVFLPKGCGNSFQTTQPNTYYSYLVDDYWTPEKYNEYVFVNLADPDLNIDWPIKLSDSIMSDRDHNHPFLKDIRNLKA